MNVNDRIVKMQSHDKIFNELAHESFVIFQA